MKTNTYLYFIDNGLIIDNLKPIRKICKDLYIVKLDSDNKCIIEYYTRIQNNKSSYLKGLYDDCIVIDKYGKIFGIIINGENVNIATKRILKQYKLFKKNADYETYKIKRLMMYVAYKIKIGEY